MIGQSVGKSFAYILGVYLGDGCVTKSGRYTVFRLNTIDRDFAETVKAALEELGAQWCSIHTHPVKKSSKPNHSLHARHDVLCAELQNASHFKQSLPNSSAWHREERLALVAGLMDSEGFVAANSNPTNRRYYMGFKSCDPWVPDFVKLLNELGILTGKVSTEEPLKPGYKTPMRFTIKMQSWIDSGAYFNIERKSARVRAFAEAGAYERRAWHPRRLTSETIRETPA